MKRCIDCKFYSQRFPDPEPKCSHEYGLVSTNPVNGMTILRSCAYMRTHNTCGIEADLFVDSKKPFFDKMLAKLKNSFMN